MRSERVILSVLQRLTEPDSVPPSAYLPAPVCQSWPPSEVRHGGSAAVTDGSCGPAVPLRSSAASGTGRSTPDDADNAGRRHPGDPVHRLNHLHVQLQFCACTCIAAFFLKAKHSVGVTSWALACVDFLSCVVLRGNSGWPARTRFLFRKFGWCRWGLQIWYNLPMYVVGGDDWCFIIVRNPCSFASEQFLFDLRCRIKVRWDANISCANQARQVTNRKEEL